jgi:hypothetical protein
VLVNLTGAKGSIRNDPRIVGAGHAKSLLEIVLTSKALWRLMKQLLTVPHISRLYEVLWVLEVRVVCQCGCEEYHEVVVGQASHYFGNSYPAGCMI